MYPITTGFATLDSALGGLITGDNVVWVCEDIDWYRALTAGFVTAATADTTSRCLYVDFGSGLLRDGPRVERIDAGPGTRLRSANALADELERRVRAEAPAALIVDPLLRAGRP